MSSTSFLVLFAIALFSRSTEALTIRSRQDAAPDSKCCFSLHAQGALAELVLEDTIGENLLGGGFPQGSYCVSSSFTAGALRDSLDHSCIISASSKQFQCVSPGLVSSEKFTISDAGLLQHNGSTAFLAVLTTSPGIVNSYNIFASNNTASISGAINITLLAGGYSCGALGRPSSTSVAVSTATPCTTKKSSETLYSTSSSKPAATPISASVSISESIINFSSFVALTTSTINTASLLSTSGSSNPQATACPNNINNGQFLVPNLLVPVSPASPDTAFGSVYAPIIASKNSTIYSFDIPSSPPYGNNCALLFLFPYGNQAVFPYNFTGVEAELARKGGLNFTRLDGSITNQTTFNTKPEDTAHYGTTQIIPGNNYTIATLPCPGNSKLSISAGSVGGLGLQYFQNDRSIAIGLYIAPCI